MLTHKSESVRDLKKL